MLLESTALTARRIQEAVDSMKAMSEAQKADFKVDDYLSGEEEGCRVNGQRLIWSMSPP